MSFRSKRELLQQTAPRYQQATEHQKGVILNEFVAATGYASKYAIRLLNHPGMPGLKIERPRPRHYGQEVQEVLHQVWCAANQICAKQLVPFLPTLIEALERHGHLQLRDEVRIQLLSLSPATADQLLRPYRAGSRGLSTTRPGTLLTKQIPLRTFQGWNETRPGFMEADLVAHCGTYTDGAYLSTLTLTDVATGWTECLPLLHHDQESVIQALDRTRQLLPFPLLSLDTDNGSEFINAEVLAYCQREQTTFTRGRPRQSNDQCFVEQKNGAIVRQVVGYERFVGEAAYRQLTELYRARRLYVNVFQPSMKLQSKQRAGSHAHRTYDAAQTPLQRLDASGILDGEKMQELTRVAQALDPLRLLFQLERLQQALWQHAVAPTTRQGSARTEPPLQFEVKHCAREQLPDEVISAAPARAKKRRRKYEKSGRPHDWRTRPDPFEGLWEQVTAWLMANPERTGVSLFVSLFQELQALYPGRFRATQVRILQRGLQKVRKRIILQFDNQWTEAKMVNGLPPAPVLRTAAVGARERKGTTHCGGVPLPLPGTLSIPPR